MTKHPTNRKEADCMSCGRGNAEFWKLTFRSPVPIFDKYVLTLNLPQHILDGL